MRICLNLDSSRLLRWHLWLAEALAEVPGNEVSCTFAAARHPLPPSCRLLLQLERLVHGFRENGAMDPMEVALRSLPLCGNDVDLVIDLSGEEKLPKAARVLTPLFNGMPSEIGVMAALANDEEIVIAVHDTARPSRPWLARPASVDRELFCASLDGALSCAVPLILKALREEIDSPAAFSYPKQAAPSFNPRSALARATGTVTSKAIRLLNILATGGRTWGIGWRFYGSESLLEKGEASFRVLAGEAGSFFADPFPFPYRGKNFIFFEKYLYSKNRGCIVVVTVDRSGAVSEPQIVLEEPHHLSYPFVFEMDGQIWMIPESAAARNVSLYRAVEFPYRWTHVACLMEGIEGYDATPLHHQGGIWFFICLRLWKSTSWDVLNLYRADSLTGSWTPHAAKPVLIDARFSRPAGAFIQHGGHTLRPVQDCSQRYGGAVTFCRLDALGEQEFGQTPVGRIRTGAFGCHTYNRRCGLEVIDLFGHVRDLREFTASYGPPVLEAQASGAVEQPLSRPI